MTGCSGFFTSLYATTGHCEQLVQKCQRLLRIALRYRAFMITSKAYHN
jgi:hypothetical protein